jgi:hypothetical protein
MSSSISTHAYCSLMLHACKYPSEPIWGLLLGNTTGTKTNVVDVAPLFHSDLVASTLEAALMIVQECCNDTEHQWKGLTIVGCYAANRLNSSNSVNSVTAKFGHAIKKQNVEGSGGGIIMVIDNSKLDTESNHALSFYACGKNGSWTSGNDFEVEDGAQKQLTDYIKKGTNVICDFDDHLDDPNSSFVCKRR